MMASLVRMRETRQSDAYEASTMNTSYDILGVPRSASDEAIRASFHSTAKACHPDLNGGDPAAGQKLKQLIAAYDDLKSPERRAAYDQFLEDRRRAFVRRFATSIAASLAGGGVVLLAVWALGAPPQEQVAFAPAASSPATDWERARASRDAGAVAAPSHVKASEAIKVAGREVPQVQEPVNALPNTAIREAPSVQDPVGMTTKVRKEPAAQNPEAMTTKVALREEPAAQETEGDTKSGHEEPSLRKLTPATAAKRPAKGNDPARPVTAEIRSPAFFGVAF
jgi:hypothetical protein